MSTDKMTKRQESVSSSLQTKLLPSAMPLPSDLSANVSGKKNLINSYRQKMMFDVKYPLAVHGAIGG